MSDAVDLPIVVARFFTYALAIALFGGAFYPMLAPTQDGRPARRMTAISLGLAAAAIAYLILLARQLDQSPGWPAAGVVASVAADTGFGRALAATTLLALCAGVSAHLGSRRARLALSGAALAALAFVGHAADGEGPRGAVRLALMAAHLLAVGAWLGALAPLLAAVVRGPDQARETLERFGGFGLLAVFVVVGTGLGSLAFIAVEARGALGADYLRALVTKLAFVAGVLGAAALNRWWATPMFAARPEAALRTLRWTVLLEQALGLGAIAAVALLGQLDPAM